MLGVLSTADTPPYVHKSTESPLFICLLLCSRPRNLFSRPCDEIWHTPRGLHFKMTQPSSSPSILPTISFRTRTPRQLFRRKMTRASRTPTPISNASLIGSRSRLPSHSWQWFLPANPRAGEHLRAIRCQPVEHHLQILHRVKVAINKQSMLSLGGVGEQLHEYIGYICNT